MKKRIFLTVLALTAGWTCTQAEKTYWEAFVSNPKVTYAKYSTPLLESVREGGPRNTAWSPRALPRRLRRHIGSVDVICTDVARFKDFEKRIQSQLAYYDIMSHQTILHTGQDAEWPVISMDRYERREELYLERIDRGVKRFIRIEDNHYETRVIVYTAQTFFSTKDIRQLASGQRNDFPALRTASTLTAYNGEIVYDGDSIAYDAQGPVGIERAVMTSPSINYDPTNMGTFAVYKAPVVERMPHTAKKAMWCTKEATYIGEAVRLGWPRHYLWESSKNYIRDSKTGKAYHPTGYYGLPLDETFFIEGTPGDMVFVILEYPPLPKECTLIDIVWPEQPLPVKDGAGWGPCADEHRVPVSLLQDRQKLVKFVKWSK